MEIADSILKNFSLEDNVSIREFTSGLINKSFHVETDSNGAFVLQRINKKVFENAEKIMLNILIVNDELRNLSDYHIPEIILAADGHPFHVDDSGYSWRLMKYIPNTVTYNSTDDLEVAREVGSVIGKFHSGTSGCDLDKMHVTLTDFHNLDFRIEWFLQSFQKASSERLSHAFDRIQEVEALIEYFQNRKLDLPMRVTHNDTKLNNILFDKTSGKALCLIDLDTIMPGYLIHDFGDAVRTLCNPVEEGDGEQIEDVMFDFTLFEKFLDGYVSQTGQLLTEEEWSSLAFSVEFMPYIMAVRFLTDYLFGDTYYKVDFPDQNLVRCSNQLKYLNEIQMKKVAIELSIAKAKKAFA